jgi:hypothetical protein
MIPFWDSVGVAMINECNASDIRIICRPGEIQKYLRKEIEMRFNKELHTKMIIGDSASLMGSFKCALENYDAMQVRFLLR